MGGCQEHRRLHIECRLLSRGKTRNRILNLQALYQNVSIFRNDICENDDNSENNSLKKERRRRRRRKRRRRRRRRRKEEDSAREIAISLYGMKAFRGWFLRAEGFV